MSDTTRNQIVKHLKEQSQQIDWSDLERFTAQFIATEFEMSRTVVSQYLNEAVVQGTVVKINSRPVYFFHMDVIGTAAKSGLAEKVYDKVEDFRQLAEAERRNASVFDRLIGAAGSLSYNVEQCKAAVSYPGNGLPILLLGPTGTGKSYLARLMYEYSLEEGILKEDSQFVSVNCAEYANNPELFLTNFFGFRKGAYTGADKDRKGLVSLADGGMLFLDEVHCLSSQCQEKLFHFMDSGNYHMVGDNERWYTSKTHMVMATTENPETSLLKTLLRRIPIITKIPSLMERSVQEKKELLFTLLSREADRIEMDILISRPAYESLLEYGFEGNVGQLVNCIRACTANAFLNLRSRQEGELPISIHHLPDYILSTNTARLIDSDERELLGLEDIKRELHTEKKLFLLNRDILLQFKRIIETEESTEDFLSIGQTRFEQYLDDLCLDAVLEENPREAFYHEIVKGVCAAVGKRLGIEFCNQDVLNLSRFVCDYLSHESACEALSVKYRETIGKALEVFERKDSLHHNHAARRLSKDISSSLGKELSQMGLLDLYICTSTFASQTDNRQTAGILLAHGYSTASSMAAAVNHLLGQHIFDALDMPPDVNPVVIAQKLSAYMRSLSGVKDAILLVDTGSLEDIYKHVDHIGNMNLGVIGDVTMKLALGVGEDLLRDVPVKTILDTRGSELTRHEHIYIENRRKPNAILAVCATGIGTAEKICELLKQSLPANARMDVVPYNYKSLQTANASSPVFDKYNILFIVGTDNPGIETCPFIFLEDIIEQHNASEINRVLEKLFTKEELRVFNMNLIKNFSLTNLVEHLTILNPEKVMGFAVDIVKKLQNQTGVAFKNKTIVGLYIHICCLIERLIMGRDFVGYDNIEVLETEHPDFIRFVRLAFHKVEQHYGVEIPLSEIGYIYEYIYKL